MEMDLEVGGGRIMTHVEGAGHARQVFPQEVTGEKVRGQVRSLKGISCRGEGRGREGD